MSDKTQNIIVVSGTRFGKTLTSVFLLFCLLGCFYFNYHFLGASIILQLLICFLFIMVVFVMGSKRTKRMTEMEALKYLTIKIRKELEK